MEKFQQLFFTLMLIALNVLFILKMNLDINGAWTSGKIAELTSILLLINSFLVIFYIEMSDILKNK